MKIKLTTACLFLSLSLFAQKGKTDTLSRDESKEIMNSLDIDKSSILRENSQTACDCISKIKVKNKSADDISGGIKKCIEKQVDSYSMTVQLLNSLNSGKLNDTIMLDPSKKHGQYYFDIENWLKDSCAALNYIIAADNKESESSMSSNKTALKYYKKGQSAMTGEDYEQAAEYFQKAVDEDDDFAFAWDNLAISFRKMNKYKEAIAAYKKSLSIDPKNVTPLQNLPVVYGLMKDYDKALECYQNLNKIYPNNPEGYYGIAQIYLTDKNDLENALQYMCKAYNLYIASGSPYRIDAEKNINYILGELKKQGKEDVFNRILKENNISPINN